MGSDVTYKPPDCKELRLGEQSGLGPSITDPKLAIMNEGEVPVNEGHLQQHLVCHWQTQRAQSFVGLVQELMHVESLRMRARGGGGNALLPGHVGHLLHDGQRCLLGLVVRHQTVSFEEGGVTSLDERRYDPAVHLTDMRPVGHDEGRKTRMEDAEREDVGRSLAD
jgi:hypothetical protein